MKISRRSFVGTGLAGVAGLYGTRGARAAGPQKAAAAEDGSKLWLRYAPPPADAVRQYAQLAINQFGVEGTSATAKATAQEMQTAIGAMLGLDQSGGFRIGVLVGTPQNSQRIREQGWQADLAKAGKEGFIIRSPIRLDNRNDSIVIASESEIGALYGAFHLLRLMQTGQPLTRLNISERPRLQLRLVNHWDNLDGSIERGYAGRSLWQWSELPGKISPRYKDYARAQASIGINGAAINNVNADARILSSEFLQKVAAIAEVWRPYGVRMYVSINVASPISLGGLATADPLDKGVADWWKAKASEIYKVIPDFGGFLVKANSEGQPGPKDYGRTHAEGANVLADALAPHGGNVIWRAFIYDEDVDPDRAKRAYLEFTRLDGKFKPNVLVQVKNGAIDFMPREPFHPLFGAMKQTPVLAEVQATQEYLGQAKHLVYLGTMWKEFLDADTYAKGKGSTVGKVLEGAVHPYPVTGMVSVLNPGLDTNWCGHHFSQANWYASGRLAWNHELSAERIAEEWTRMTFTNDEAAVTAIRKMMMTSRETFVNYTMPLGLHHLIGGNHYAPMPDNDRAQRRDWTATYYHQASAEGVGFDRSMKGNKAVDQYFPPVRDLFDNLKTCPEEFLLWFHRLAWDYKLKNGKTLWNGIVEKYYAGTREAAALAAAWQALAGKIDPQRHKEVADRLATQSTDAAQWRDQILKYFQRYSKMEIRP
jgi:alpha-glucuronidase